MNCSSVHKLLQGFLNKYEKLRTNAVVLSYLKKNYFCAFILQ